MTFVFHLERKPIPEKEVGGREATGEYERGRRREQRKIMQLVYRFFAMNTAVGESVLP